MDKIIYFVGQGLGFVAIALGILSYQMKSQKNLLILQTANSLVFCIHYLMIGATSGMALNLVGVLRNATYFYRHTKGGRGRFLPLFFTAVTAVIGVITWEAWYSVFIFSGIVIHCFCMSFSDAQKVRASILVTSPLVIVYDAFTFSVGGIIYESIAILSSVIGIIRHRKRIAEIEK